MFLLLQPGADRGTAGLGKTQAPELMQKSLIGPEELGRRTAPGLTDSTDIKTSIKLI